MGLVTPNSALSLECLHMDFGGIVATGPATPPSAAFLRFDNDLTIATLSLGINCRM